MIGLLLAFNGVRPPYPVCHPRVKGHPTMIRSKLF